jgi:hypothetical protein
MMLTSGVDGDKRKDETQSGGIIRSAKTVTRQQGRVQGLRRLADEKNSEAMVWGYTRRDGKMKTIIIKSIEEAGAHLGNAGRKEWLNTAHGSETPVDIGGYRYILRPEWTHCRWQEPDGELIGDPPTMSHSGDRWVTTAGDPVETGDVIEWAPLPLRGVRAVYPDVVTGGMLGVQVARGCYIFACATNSWEEPLCKQLGTKRHQMHITFVEIEE